MARKASSPARIQSRQKLSGKTNSFNSRIKIVDSQDLKSDYDKWPEMAERIWNNPDATIQTKDRKCSRIVFAGMGGSGITGEVITDYFREIKSEISVETVKDYHLPNNLNNDTLVIGMSSSGNTEETLSVLSEASARGLDAWTFGSGGSIETLSKSKWRFPFVKTEMLKVPRGSFPGLFFYVLKQLQRSGLLQVRNEDVDDSIKTMGIVRGSCAPLDATNPALRLAKNILKQGIPVIYASSRTHAVALRARQSFNENAKLHIFDGVIPELCHNDIVGWDSKAASVRSIDRLSPSDRMGAALLLRLEDDPLEIKTRFEIVEEIVGSGKGKALEVPYFGNSYLSRILSMFYLLDYTSYFLAIIRGIDPIKTPSIDLLKRALASRLNYLDRLK